MDISNECQIFDVINKKKKNKIISGEIKFFDYFTC